MRASSVPVERRSCSKEALASRPDSAGRGRRRGQGPCQGPSLAPARIFSAPAHDSGAAVRKEMMTLSSPREHLELPSCSNGIGV